VVPRGPRGKIISEQAILANPAGAKFVFRGLIATKYLDLRRRSFLDQ
jgi:hypothetical protein